MNANIAEILEDFGDSDSSGEYALHCELGAGDRYTLYEHVRKTGSDPSTLPPHLGGKPPTPPPAPTPSGKKKTSKDATPFVRPQMGAAYDEAAKKLKSLMRGAESIKAFHCSV